MTRFIRVQLSRSRMKIIEVHGWNSLSFIYENHGRSFNMCITVSRLSYSVPGIKSDRSQSIRFMPFSYINLLKNVSFVRFISQIDCICFIWRIISVLLEARAIIRNSQRMDVR